MVRFWGFNVHDDEGKGAAAGDSTSRPLWTDKDYARWLNVGERKFAEMESQGLTAAPVMLGPRLKRYVPAEAEAKLLEMPRSLQRDEPEHLATARRAKIERMKAGPVGRMGVQGAPA